MKTGGGAGDIQLYNSHSQLPTPTVGVYGLCVKIDSDHSLFESPMWYCYSHKHNPTYYLYMCSQAFYMYLAPTHLLSQHKEHNKYMYLVSLGGILSSKAPHCCTSYSKNGTPE